jgi:hypothetical protein
VGVYAVYDAGDEVKRWSFLFLVFSYFLLGTNASALREKIEGGRRMILVQPRIILRPLRWMGLVVSF